MLHIRSAIAIEVKQEDTKRKIISSLKEWIHSENYIFSGDEVFVFRFGENRIFRLNNRLYGALHQQDCPKYIRNEFFHTLHRSEVYLFRSPVKNRTFNFPTMGFVKRTKDGKPFPVGTVHPFIDGFDLFYARENEDPLLHGWIPEGYRRRIKAVADAPQEAYNELAKDFLDNIDDVYVDPSPTNIMYAPSLKRFFLIDTHLRAGVDNPPRNQAEDLMDMLLNKGRWAIACPDFTEDPDYGDIQEKVSQKLERAYWNYDLKQKKKSKSLQSITDKDEEKKRNGFLKAYASLIIRNKLRE